MPTISRFFGIIIFMNYNDHMPPHFHDRYQDQEVTVEIETGVVQDVAASSSDGTRLVRKVSARASYELGAGARPKTIAIGSSFGLRRH